MRYLLALLLVSPASGQLIDDFDDPASVVSPAMENVFVRTENVGPLDALREIRLASIAANADATLTIGDGVMRADVGSLHAINPDIEPHFAAQMWYTFEPADFSSGNAFMFDFNSVVGQPDFVRIIIYDGSGHSFVAEYRPIPERGHTAVFPFDTFLRRNGQRWPINFETIQGADVSIYARRSHDPNHHWAVEIDRIYVATVPEPEGLFLFLFTLFWRRRTCERSC